MPKHLRTIILALAAISTIVVGGVYGFDRASLWLGRDRVRYAHGDEHSWFSMEMPGVDRPGILDATHAGLDDGEEVIGVEVGGKARAYRVAALRDRSRHIINDVIDGLPISVAYCDLSDCVRVYTDRTSNAPLDVSVAGLFDGEMVVKLRGANFIHRTGARLEVDPGTAAPPYEQLCPSRTTWKRWLSQHPASDVYAGKDTD